MGLLQPSTWPKTVTISLLITVAAILIGWDIYVAVAQPVADTISRVVLGFAGSHPVFGFAIGVVCGHLLWPQRIPAEK